MGRTKKSESKNSKKIRPASSPEAREKQLISLAVNLAEKQLMEGTASSQVITHYLKLGSTREQLETEIREKKKELIELLMHMAERFLEKMIDLGFLKY